MLIYLDKRDENQLKDLRQAHEDSNVTSIDDLILKLPGDFREALTSLDKVQVSRDGLLGALRRAEWLYSETEKITFDYTGHDKRESLLIGFFHNAKCFIEIIKKCFNEMHAPSKHGELFKDVTAIRNFLAHSYESDKNTFDKAVFVRVQVNHHLNDGLYELEIFDFETSKKIHSVFFSLKLFLLK